MSITSGATHSGEDQTNGITRIPASAASSTSVSKPDQLGFETAGFFGCSPAQYIGSRTLSIPASAIRSKSLALEGFWGEIPMKPGGR
jgi:hypothetical protein